MCTVEGAALSCPARARGCVLTEREEGGSKEQAKKEMLITDLEAGVILQLRILQSCSTTVT